MIRNIIFDVGNVLIDFRWKEYLKELGFSDFVISELGERVIMDRFWHELDLGVMEETDVIKAMKQKNPDLSEYIDKMFEDPTDIVRPYPGTRDWLLGLKENGYHLFLLSNYPKNMFALHEKKVFNFMDLVEGAVVSAREKMTKPQPEIYELILNRYELDPEETVFLDDREENLEAAKEFDIETILVRNQEQAKQDLEELLKR